MCKVICIQNKQTAMFFTIAVTGLYWRWCRHWLTTFPSLSCSFPTSAVQVRSWWVFSCFASQIIRCSSDPSSCFKSENDWWDAPPPRPRGPRPPPWPLSGLVFCNMVLHLEGRSGLVHAVLDMDVTRFCCVGVLLPSHHSCSLPRQVSIRGNSLRFLTCLGLMIYELRAETIIVLYFFSFHPSYVS